MPTRQDRVRIILAITLLLAVVIGLVWFGLDHLETEESGPLGRAPAATSVGA